MKVLVVDDEPEVADIVSLAFSFHRPEYEVVKAHSGAEALRKVGVEHPDIAILDVSMPGMSGLQVTKRLHGSLGIPVILLTARGSEEDKVRGLESGADDYIVKPFGHRELIARVDAVMRRAAAAQPPALPGAFQHKDLRIDTGHRRVYRRDQEVLLTPTEYSLLYHLVGNRGEVVDQETLLAKVWGQEYRDESHYLKVYIRRLREKIEDDPGDPYFVRTVRRSGYLFPGSEED